MWPAHDGCVNDVIRFFFSFKLGYCRYDLNKIMKERKE